MPQISIETIIKQAKAAQTEFENAGQEVVDELITGLAWSLLEPELTVLYQIRLSMTQDWGMLMINSPKITVRHWASSGT
ncbi:MAG: hypothetical protein CM1200mP30_07240 [Pseudomonadota bacterium]|nr:MAG: hypothetical protein CM1200mP30_07240 [Pseudomonadota bacterium]